MSKIYDVSYEVIMFGTVRAKNEEEAIQYVHDGEVDMIEEKLTSEVTAKPI